MTFRTIILEKTDGVARIIFNRPDVLNAFNYQMSKELKEVIRDISVDKEVRLVIITGAGNAFMSGADISMVYEWTNMNEKEVRKIFEESFNPTMLEQLPQPVIAAVNGYAFGMGCEIALGCDFRIASDNAQFGQLEIRLGIMTGEGGSVRLPRLIGKLKAMEIILTGDRIDAQEAYRIGLVNKVVPHEALDQEINKIVEKLKSKSVLAMKNSKISVNRSMETGLEEALDNELSLFCKVIKSFDAKEGISAFLQNKKPT